MSEWNHIPLLIMFSMMIGPGVQAATPKPVRIIIVDASGQGDFKTVQGAINSLPASPAQTRIIRIRKGHYSEKIYIEKDNIVLEGEDREQTVISASIARDEWRCAHADDWGVATINIEGNDVTLKNLTIANNYGFDQQQDRMISCLKDTINHQKKIIRTGHQMALRTFQCSRLKVIHCLLKAFGGDTVSPWNTADGMYYFKDCILEGGVDFYCPRGWAYAEDCTFIAHSGTASIWHDGSGNADEKTVLVNCHFTGFDGFKLGRYHRDAQFYLINCVFANNMADTDIYLVPTSNNIRWGRRVYYYNCHRQGGDYDWYKNNLASAPGHPDPSQIDAKWIFGNRWNPLQTEN
jgi:pectinesterase